MKLTFNSRPIQDDPDAGALTRAVEKLAMQDHGAVGLERDDDGRLVLILAGSNLELHLRRGPRDHARLRLEPGDWPAAARALEEYRRGQPFSAAFEDYDADAEFPEIRRSVARMLSWRPLLLPRRAGTHPDDILLRGDPKGEACVMAYSDMATLLADCPGSSAAKHVGFAELLAYANSEERFGCLMVHALGAWIPIPRADFAPMLEELGCPAGAA